MKTLPARLLLSIAGLLLITIGTAVLFKPATFAAANGISLGNSVSLLSEYRAPGGMLITSALLILLGAVRQKFMQTGFFVAALVYCSYGVSRLVAVIADGLPSAALTQAMFVELLLGTLCLAAFVRARMIRVSNGQR